MPGANKTYEDIGELYEGKIFTTTKEQIVNEGQKVDATQDMESKDATAFKGFSETGPEASEEFEASPNDIKVEKKKDSAYDEEKLSNPVKMEENNINNSTMRQNQNKLIILVIHQEHLLILVVM